MPEFLKLLPPGEALQIFLRHLTPQVLSEQVKLVDGLGRVLTQGVVAPHPLPAFPRSTVDGYAVRAASTFGASESLPAYLNMVGEIAMGSTPGVDVGVGQAVLIHTGGMLPASADAVVMVEYTQPGSDLVEVYRAVAAGENTIKTGEDVAAGEEVLQAGVRIRPAEIGGLASFGIEEVAVAHRPEVGILSSGDEIVKPGEQLQPGQVRDVNSYTLSALVEQAGGKPRRYGVFPDDTQILKEAARRALAECDMLVFTAGSSASARDLTAEVINSLGEPGVLVHGVNVRPGKPTILAICQGKAVIGLPGNPVSALVIASLFLVPAISRLLGFKGGQPVASVPARLMVNLPSQAGRDDWVPVRLTMGAAGYTADPVFSKSNLIFSMVRADGLVHIPADATGISAGELVQVQILS